MSRCRCAGHSVALGRTLMGATADPLADGVDRAPTSFRRPTSGPPSPLSSTTSRPPGSSGALLWIHGGGLVMGSPESGQGLCSRFAAAHGIVVVSVDYRLAPEDPFPAGLDDSVDALTWIHDHASDLDVDPSGSRSAATVRAPAWRRVSRNVRSTRAVRRFVSSSSSTRCSTPHAAHGRRRRIGLERSVESVRLVRLSRAPSRGTGPAGLRRCCPANRSHRVAAGLDRHRRHRSVPRRGHRLRTASRRRGCRGRTARRARHVPRCRGFAPDAPSMRRSATAW